MLRQLQQTQAVTRMGTGPTYCSLEQPGAGSPGECAGPRRVLPRSSRSGASQTAAAPSSQSPQRGSVVSWERKQEQLRALLEDSHEECGVGAPKGCVTQSGLPGDRGTQAALYSLLPQTMRTAAAGISGCLGQTPTRVQGDNNKSWKLNGR